MANQRDYLPAHETTQNYNEGMSALCSGNLELAIDILDKEPENSSCYTLSRGNMALALLRLEQYSEAERVGWSVLNLTKILGCPHPPSQVQFARNLCETIAKQSRYDESLQMFNQTCHLANELMEEFPSMSKEIELEKAHTMDSWGNSLLYLEDWKASIEIYNGSRKIYLKYIDINKIGVAEVLTNLAIAYRYSNSNIEAELALREALDIAEENGNYDQINRIYIGLIQMRSSIINIEDAFNLIEKGVSETIS